MKPSLTRETKSACEMSQEETTALALEGNELCFAPWSAMGFLATADYSALLAVRRRRYQWFIMR